MGKRVIRQKIHYCNLCRAKNVQLFNHHGQEVNVNGWCGPCLVRLQGPETKLKPKPKKRSMAKSQPLKSVSTIKPKLCKCNGRADKEGICMKCGRVKDVAR